jgi:sulfatase maturation enzyme AslB (radical SAM superfamily)
MRQLAKKKKGDLGFSFLVRTEADGFGIESNIHEIYPAALLAKEIGCDYFEVKPSYSYVGGQAHALVVHSAERMEEAKKEIARLDALSDDNFRIIKAINMEDSLARVEHRQQKTYETCPVAELRTLVCPSGVFVCPYWRGKEKFRIGDAHTMSFSEIWNGERRREVRKYVNPCTVCSFHCLRHESNVEVLNIIEQGRDEIEMRDEYDRFI